MDKTKGNDGLSEQVRMLLCQNFDFGADIRDRPAEYRRVPPEKATLERWSLVGAAQD